MRKVFFLLFLFYLFISGIAQPVISYQSFITGLSSPVEVVNAVDGSKPAVYCSTGGVIRVYDPSNGGLQANPFLDISTLVRFSGEQGSLGAVFHPDYKNNGYFFVYYNNTSGDITVARYRVSANVNLADAASQTVLLAIPKPFTNHNGGHLQFGKDGYLYFGTGDGGSANDPNNHAQDPMSLLGKMIRINVDEFTTPPYYSVPADNPFVGDPAYDSHIWALGLRNPFRWSFDRQTGDMWIGDVGQGAKEEIYFRPASSTGGENYGWRCYEGSIRNPNIPPCDPQNYIPPIFDYNNPSAGSVSVVGGYVYRGAEYTVLQGWYLASDVYTRNIYLIKPNGSGGWTTIEQPGAENFVVGYGEAEDGTLYAASQGSNAMYKVVAFGSVLPLVLQQFSASVVDRGTELRWTTASEEAHAKFVIEYGQDGRHFSKLAELMADGNTNGGSYVFVHSYFSPVPLYYRLQLVENGAGSRYSSIVKVEGRRKPVQVYPTLVRDGKFVVSSTGKVEQVQVINSSGKIVLRKRLANNNNPVSIQLPVLAKGIYIVHVYEGKNTSLHKILVE